MEHLATFGLERDPFANEPHLAPWFPNPCHEDAQRRLARGIAQRKGLCLLLGEGGAGKTLLARQVLEGLEEEVFEACLLVPVPGVSDGRWILDRFARQLGVEEPAREGEGLLAQIYEQLAIVREDGRHTVLLLDEAQVLAARGALAELRGLLNLEYEERRLLTLVLIGLPDLGHRVAEDPALADRVEVRVRVAPFDGATAAAYLEHRLRCAGGDPAVLDAAARDALVKLGAGSPGRLNKLADNALFEAHLAGRAKVTAADVERAAAELGLAAPDAPTAATGTPRPNGRAATAGDAASPPVRPEAMARVDRTERVADDVTTLFAGPEADEDDGEELGEVFADDTSPPVRRGAPDATVALLDDQPDLPGGARIATDEERRRRAAPAQTVAFLGDPEQSDGDLDDLFADLVEE